MSIGNPMAIVDGQPTRLEQAPILYRGSKMVPLRFVSESLGAKVNYDARTKRIATAGNSAGGGTTQRSGEEGSKGETLQQEPFALRLDAVQQEAKYGTNFTVVHGTVRNLTTKQLRAQLDDGVLVLNDGRQIKSTLQLDQVVPEQLPTGDTAKLKIYFKRADVAETTPIVSW